MATNAKRKKDPGTPLKKKNLIRAAIGLSVLLNVVAIIVVVVVIVDIRTGTLNYLTDGNLQLSTCSNYLSRADIQSSATYKVGNVVFEKTYFTRPEQQNVCTAVANNVSFLGLIESNNPTALNYYDKTTGFTSPNAYQFPVALPYDAQTRQPINPLVMSFGY